MRTNPSPIALALAVAVATIAVSGRAAAEPYAEPPPGHDAVAVAAPADEPPADLPTDAARPSSTVRLFVGPAGKLAGTGASPGLVAALELGRGPTGFRVAGGWVDVGSDRGLAQYTGELTIDFGGRSRIRPAIGAGGGVARTSSSRRADGSLDTTTGATLGIGTVRGGVGVRLPFDEADARVALDLSGNFPVVRGDGARDVQPWALASITVGVGF